MAIAVNSDDGPVQRREQWNVRIRVPEEYLGYVIGELSSRDGRIKALTHDNHISTIEALVPAAEYASIANVISTLPLATNAEIRHEHEF